MQTAFATAERAMNYHLGGRQGRVEILRAVLQFKVPIS